MTQYEQQAKDFLTSCNAKINKMYLGTETNADWNETRERDTYICNIITPLGNMQVKFWDSINDTISNKNRRDIGLCRKYPSDYDILACLQKYDAGELEDFIFEFDYTIEKRGDLKRIKNIYDAVIKEYNDVCRCFTPKQIEKLQEIA